MPEPTGNLRVNGERLRESLMRLAEIGATEKGGVCRLAASDLDGEARRLFIGWCEDAGCTVRVDKIGNIFARRAGGRKCCRSGRSAPCTPHPCTSR